MVNCQNSRDKGPPEGNSARGWAKTLFHNNTKYAFAFETKHVLTCPVNTQHLYDFMQCWTNVEDVGPTLYKCYLFNGGSMLGQRRRRWPSIKTALDQCSV